MAGVSLLETPLGLGAFQTVTAAADAIIWGLAAPVILTAAALPVRAIFNFRRIDLNLLLKASPAELVDALRSLLITGFSAVYAAAPAALVLLGYFFWAKDQSVTSLRQIYLLTCAAICIITLARSLPVYFAPFVTICGGYGPREGLFLTNRILGPRRIALAVMLAGWTLCSWAVYIALPFSTASIVIQAAAAWYALTYISIYVMRAVAEFEEQRLPRPKPAGLRKGTHKAPPHEPEYFSVENVHMVH